jgi:erythromycin esterase-like protein
MMNIIGNIFKKKKTWFFIVVAFILLAILLAFFLFKTNQKKETYYPLESSYDLEPLVIAAAEADFVLLGEASHGTSEYYQWRAEISQWLIKNHGFRFVVVEGDWDALYQLNLYVKHHISPPDGAREIMNTFARWPSWMWANEEFLVFVEWLRGYNENMAPEDRISLYGKDIYGAYNSMLLVLDYLENIDLELADLAQNNYHCLLKYENNFNAYVSDLAQGETSCAAKVQAVFDSLLAREDYLKTIDEKKYFNAQQNALVVIHAESHYRYNLSPGPRAWNARVLGMKSIFNNIANRNKDKGIVWAHNTHIGDARATEMQAAGMLNIGQLLREKVGEDRVFSIGFGSYRGTVIAGSSWGSLPQILIMPPAKEGSFEDLLAGDGVNDFYIIFDQQNSIFNQVWGHRAKGVVYLPVNDHLQYVDTVPAKRYNAFIFIYQSQALKAF